MPMTPSAEVAQKATLTSTAYSPSYSTPLRRPVLAGLAAVGFMALGLLVGCFSSIPVSSKAAPSPTARYTVEQQEIAQVQNNINQLLIYYQTHRLVAPNGNGFFQPKPDSSALGGYTVDTAKPLTFGVYDVEVGAYVQNPNGNATYVLNCGAVTIGAAKVPKVAAFVLYAVYQGGKEVPAVGIVFMSQTYGDIIQATSNNPGGTSVDLNAKVNSFSHKGQGSELPNAQTFLDAVAVLNGSENISGFGVAQRTQGPMSRFVGELLYVDSQAGKFSSAVGDNTLFANSLLASTPDGISDLVTRATTNPSEIPVVDDIVLAQQLHFSSI